MAQTPALHDRALYADIVGGMTTFFTMAYIVVVNPGILAAPGTGMPFSGALTATVLIASSMTLLMGLYARLPFAVAPGMGLNAFFAFTIVLQSKVPWQTALGILIAAALMRRHNPLAFLTAIFAVTALAWTLGYAKPPDQVLSAPDFSSA